MAGIIFPIGYKIDDSDLAAAEGSFKGFAGKIGGILAGLGIAAGIGAAVKTGFGELMDASAGTAQLQSGIKSTGNAANVTVGGLNNLASSIQAYSGQTDDSIVSSEKLLLTFGNIKNGVGAGNDIFNQATKVTADMAAKMGGDASGSAMQLGKALQDPVNGISALTRVGVSFTDGQKEQIKSMVANGDTMGAQKVILAELNKEFGGAAEAYGNSLPGMIDRSKRAFEDIAQVLAETLLPIITPLLEGFLNLFTKVQPYIEKFADKLGGLISTLMSGSSDIGTFFGNISGAIQDFVSGGGLEQMVQGFITGREKIFTAIADIAPQLITSLSTAMIDAIPALVQALVDGIPVLIDTATGLFTSLLTAMDKVLPKLIKAIADAIPKIIDAIMTALPDMIDSAVALFSGLIEGLTKVIPDVIVALLDALPQLVDSLLTMLPQLIDGAVKLFTGLVDALIKVLPTLLSTLTDKVLPKLIDTLVALIPVLIPAGVKLFLALVDAVTTALPKIIEAVIKIVPEITKALIKALPQLIDAGAQLLGGLLKGLWDNAPTLIANVAAKLGNALIDSVKAIFGIKSPSRVFHEIGGFITQGLANGLTAGVGLVEDAMSLITDATSMDAGDVNIGVAGGGYAGGSSRGVTNVNVTVNAGMGADGGDIGRKIVTEIKKYERTNGAVWAMA
jgi:hypothetical protein